MAQPAVAQPVALPHAGTGMAADSDAPVLLATLGAAIGLLAVGLGVMSWRRHGGAGR